MTVMNDLEAIEARHSVRSFTSKAIEGDVLAQLQQTVARCNEESGLSMQLCIDNPEAFDGTLAHYGKFENVRNHLALVGPKALDLDERCGYYGERVVLEAQKLGLNTCWVALTYRKKASNAIISAGQKCVCVIALGYGTTQGAAHKVKPLEKLCRIEGPMPAWFRAGAEAARLAPTATNQQKFLLELTGENKVAAKALRGPYARVDLGIVKQHFEVGANSVSRVWTWA